MNLLQHALVSTTPPAHLSLDRGRAAVERLDRPSEWTPVVVGRALLAQRPSGGSGWLSNPRIDVLHLYAALLRPVRGECPDRRLLVVFDTTVLWNLFCVVRLCLVYRGRRFPRRGRSCGIRARASRSGTTEGCWGWWRGCSAATRWCCWPTGFPARRVVALGPAHGGWHLRVRCKRNVGLFRRMAGAMAGWRCGCRRGSALLPRGVRDGGSATGSSRGGLGKRRQGTLAHRQRRADRRRNPLRVRAALHDRRRVFR